MKFVLPNVSSEEARKILAKRPKVCLRHERRTVKTELLYLPYYVHNVVVLQGREEHEVVVCTDGICSGFSFFNAEHAAFSDSVSGVIFDFMVSPEEARQSCLDNLRWHLVRQGLRLKVKASVTGICKEEKIYYPYWVAYFKGANGYDFRAADAVTGEIQGVRMRKVFLAALSQSAGADGAPSAARNAPQSAQSAQRL